jgi:putative transposase
MVDQWVYENGVEFHFIEPGKSTQNAYIESFNGKFRDEWLNQNRFLSLNNARRIDVTGLNLSSGSERNHSKRRAGHADEETQAGANCGAVAAD